MFNVLSLCVIDYVESEICEARSNPENKHNQVPWIASSCLLAMTCSSHGTRVNTTVSSADTAFTNTAVQGGMGVPAGMATELMSAPPALSV